MSWLLYAVLGLLVALWLRWRLKNRRLLVLSNKLPGPPTLPGIGNALKFMCQPEGKHLMAKVNKNRRLLVLSNKLPGPPTLPGIGNALEFMCQPEEFIIVLKDMMEDYGDVLSFWLGPDLNVMVKSPDDLKILLSNMKTCVKGPQYRYMADVLGGGILSGSGPSWRRHRKIATPNYGKRAIEAYSAVFNDEVDHLLEKFREVTGTFDIYKKIVQTTSYSVCRTLMGLSREQTLSLPYIQEIIEDSPRLYDIVFARMTKWYLQIDPIFWLSKFYRDQKRIIRKITEFSKTILQNRTKHLKTLEEQNKIDLMNTADDTTKNGQLSVIDRFLLSQDLNAKELLDETFTIFTSSQEASAKITSYLLLMMAYHPQCQEKLYAEIKDVIGETDRPVTDEDLKQMPYLEMVFKEIVRLFPIGAMIQRTVVEDINIGSATLPAGCSLVVPIYHLHRDSQFWSRPDAFDPERFSPEITKERHPYCYIPFSLGPMDCLGRYFGTKLVKTICVRVLREFIVTSPKTYEDLKLAISISVVSVDGYQAKLTPRTKSIK